MLGNISNPSPSSEPFPSPEDGSISKRKRRPAGTPDPDAEVVSLSPKTLLESDRYVCEICNQGFQRDQNLQMHRRRHKVPWKLLKRETPVARKRVFVCPEPSCLHHDPCHALGDLVGIKKHFRRKHSNHKQWVCEKCSKGYAVQSDYKAHLKTCGTRGHSCDCGRVFSRVESFIEHQDDCSMGRLRSECPPTPPPTACLSRTASSPSPSNCGGANMNNFRPGQPNLELQLLTERNSSSAINIPDYSTKFDEDHSTQLQLSIGSSENIEKNEFDDRRNAGNRCSPRGSSSTSEKPTSAARLTELAQEQLALAMAEKAYAEEARRQAKRQIEVAEQQFANAKRIRQQALGELEKAQALKEHAIKQMNSIVLQITCSSCKLKFKQSASATPLPLAEASSSRENFLGLGYISAALREWEIKKSDQS
ncbi:protein SHOOT GRAVITROPISM 5-like [Dorcoceras hygrometricum]|uniref:Protein SHOOT GRAVITROPISM 5-like n=1 Tax=Dorcoceras hygrometricum TaxID=472368 RepID=A0A2Z7CJA4_9LAMI|nr:protein SHOOT GRAVITROPISM 5-like [Dorcoceras hygrometricum]